MGDALRSVVVVVRRGRSTPPTPRPNPTRASLQSHEMSFVPCFPAAIFKSAAQLADAAPEDLLPPVPPSKGQISLLGVLGGVHYTTLGSQSIWQKATLALEVRS